MAKQAKQTKQLRWTIYCHIHRESGRRYVGLTKATWRQRWNRHVYAAKRGKGSPGFSHFANAIRKYGPNAFDHEVLETRSSLEEANAAEARWISHFKTRDPEFGFNLTPGGTHAPHPVRNPWDRPETRSKMLAAAKRRGQDPVFRAKAIANITAVNASTTFEERSERAKALWTDEHRMRMSIISKEVQSRSETREKNAAAHRGKELSLEHRAKIGSALSGKKRPTHVAAKTAEALRGRKLSQEHCAKISERQRGRTLSQETRAKIGEKARLAAARRALME